jgi:hypothetical protein
LPLSAVTVKLFVSPVIVTSSASKMALDTWPVPDARRQSMQWHCAMRTGAPLTASVTAPHKHSPAECTSFAICTS